MLTGKETIQVTANAKINLALKIKSRREDGYHDIESIFQEIDFSDCITLHKNDRLNFSTNAGTLPIDSKNICLKAAELLIQYFNIPGLDIHLEKRIPVGAGLGGGSSDAAAVLSGANQLYDLKINYEQMLLLAVKLGADVPFFLSGGSAYASGIGDILKRISLYSDYQVLLVFPKLNISTHWAYKNLKLGLTRESPDSKFRGFRFHDLDLNRFKSEFYNDFEISVFKQYPILAEIKSALYDKGASFAAMSGSGSVLFGLFDSLRSVNKAYDSLHSVYQCLKTKPVLR